MKNILFNLQITHLKCFLKTGQNTIFWPLSKNCKNSLFESQRKNLCFINTRYLTTSVKNVEKSTQNNVSNTTKKDNSIIYIGSLSSQVKGVKMFTCISSFGGIVIQPWLIQNIINGSNQMIDVALFSFVGLFTFITPLFIHFLTKKYVTEIWYNSTTDTYTATVLSFFLRRININFKAEDVHVPFVLPPFTTMYIKGKPVFVISDSFLEVEYYLKMIGYDKPIDFNSSNVKHVPKQQNIEKY